MAWTTPEVVQMTGARLLRGRGDRSFSAVSIDSRTLVPGSLFVALRGERYDGHDFAKDALERGAGGLVVEEGSRPAERGEEEGAPSVIAVPDTLRALQDLAHAHRMRRSIPVVAVTGSNGKTSTKEMLFSILRGRYRAYRSPGNLNNQIGVPLSLLAMEPETEAAVLEFGMSGFGEIRRLAEIARPTVAVITNVSEAHLTELASPDDVARAKAEILEDLPPGGRAVLNRDDPRVFAMRGRLPGRTLCFGLHPEAEVRAEEIEAGPEGSRFLLRQAGDTAEATLSTPGLHQIANALAAAAAARALGLSLVDAARGLAAFRPLSMRWETSTLPGGAVIINDAYNANPASMTAAIETVVRMGPGRRNVAVLGDMRELGALSETVHRRIGRRVAEAGFALLLTVGSEAERIGEECRARGMDPGRIFRCRDWDQAAEKLREVLEPQDRVLVKGSRALGLERIVEALHREA